MPAHLPELQAPARRLRPDRPFGAERVGIAAHVVEGRQESLVAAVPARESGAHTVPEVEGKGAVREVEPERSARGEQARVLGEKRDAEGVAIGQRRDLVPVATAFRHADVLENARTENRVECPVAKRQAETVGAREPVAAGALPPLPLAKRGEVRAPGVEPLRAEKVDRQTVAAAAVEHVPGTPGGEQRQVEVADARHGARHLVREALALRFGLRLPRNEGVEVSAFGKVHDPILTGKAPGTGRAALGRGLGDEAFAAERADIGNGGHRQCPSSNVSWPVSRALPGK